MDLEDLDVAKILGSQRDIETLEDFAERNGFTTDTVRGWTSKGRLPSLRVGKRRVINSALFRAWLLDQEWTA